eukprot:3165447-Pyramimonas_sp.AAC.1
MIRQGLRSVNGLTPTHANPLRILSFAASSQPSLIHTGGTCTCRTCTCPVVSSVDDSFKLSAKVSVLPKTSNLQQRGFRTLGAVSNAAKGEGKTGSAISGRLFGACVLERYPVIMPESSTWEKEYQARPPPVTIKIAPKQRRLPFT